MVKSFTILISFLFISLLSLGQDTIRVDFFSINYKLLIIAKNCNQDSCYGDTKIIVSDRKNGKYITTIKVDKVLTNNIIADPINFGDYNFDSVEDIVIRSGYTNDGRPKYSYYIFRNGDFHFDSVIAALSKMKSFCIPNSEKQELEFVCKNQGDYRIREFYKYIGTNKKIKLSEKVIEDARTNKNYIIVTTEKFIGNQKSIIKKKYLKEKYLWSEL